MCIVTGSLLQTDDVFCIFRLEKSYLLIASLIASEQASYLFLFCAVLEQCLWGSHCSLSGGWIIFTSCPFMRPSLPFSNLFYFF